MANLEDEAAFQLARKILIAELQNIVYTEYLPLVLGMYDFFHSLIFVWTLVALDWDLPSSRYICTVSLWDGQVTV
jgi:hypothetical protein